MMSLRDKAAATALLFACAAVPAGAAERTVPVSGFDRFGTSSIDTVIKVGPAFSLVLTGPADQLLKVEVLVKNSELELRPKRRKGSMWNRSEEVRNVTAVVTMPTLREVSIGGSGNVVAQGVKTKKFEMNIGGSGTITAENAVAEIYEGNIGGSGDIIVSGSCGSADFSIGGSGNIKAQNLKCKSLDVSIGGSGKVSAYAAVSSDISIAGGGDVKVYGNPASRKKSIAGSGDISYPQ
jgi:Putative auto-transporter adhesin, head GIN domain